MAKIIKIQNDIQRLIEKAQNRDRLAQKQLFEAYSGALLSVCRLYINDLQFAEDILLKGFLKIFNNLPNYHEEKHFYSWTRRIMINECIDFLRSKNQKTIFAEWDERYDTTEDFPTIDSQQSDAIQSLLDTLPCGCRSIFCLFVFDDFSHKEIATMLKISEGTSKSQVAYAKKILKEKLTKNNYGRTLEKYNKTSI